MKIDPNEIFGYVGSCDNADHLRQIQSACADRLKIITRAPVAEEASSIVSPSHKMSSEEGGDAHKVEAMRARLAKRESLKGESSKGESLKSDRDASGSDDKGKKDSSTVNEAGEP